jgi:ABC-type branched-subunit amino acid transport system ATPase component
LSFLEIEQLVAGYGEAIVLRDINLSVDKGETVAVVGRNGAGKSTLLLSLFGGCAIRGGSIRVGGQRVERSPGFVTPRFGVAIAPQGRMILPHLTIRENLLLGAAARRRGPWTLATVYRLFPILQERSRSLGTALSGGQQQMLAIGRALMANPSVLLLDEPSEGLSPVIIDEIITVLGDIKGAGTGILIVEQHLNLVRRVSERFVILVKGQIAGAGLTSDIGSPEYRAALTF